MKYTRNEVTTALKIPNKTENDEVIRLGAEVLRLKNRLNDLITTMIMINRGKYNALKVVKNA